MFLLLSLLFASPCAQAADNSPRITGAAHMAYYVSDLKQARDFYEGLLGFQEAFAVKNADGTDHIVYIKINDTQYILLYAGETKKNYGFVRDAGFATNDARGMRDRLAALGVKVPATVEKDAAGNLSFDFIEPSGFTIEVVQYLPDSMTGKARGKFMPATRISDHIDHMGLLIRDKPTTWDFYSKAFGFEKDGDGSKMIIPGTNDRFELGWERRDPVEARFHIKDHICLSVNDVPKMTASLQAKPLLASEFPKAIADVHQLGSGKNVVELYDNDGNRVENMEPPKSN